MLIFSVVWWRGWVSYVGCHSWNFQRFFSKWQRNGCNLFAQDRFFPWLKAIHIIFYLYDVLKVSFIRHSCTDETCFACYNQLYFTLKTLFASVYVLFFHKGKKWRLLAVIYQRPYQSRVFSMQWIKMQFKILNEWKKDGEREREREKLKYVYVYRCVLLFEYELLWAHFMHTQRSVASQMQRIYFMLWVILIVSFLVMFVK